MCSSDLAPLVLSACKRADGRDGLIVRFYNPTTETLRARLQVGMNVDRAFECDLAENRLRDLTPTGDGGSIVEIEAGAKEIVTLELVANGREA